MTFPECLQVKFSEEIFLTDFPDFTWLHIPQVDVFNGSADQPQTGMFDCCHHFPHLMEFAFGEYDFEPGVFDIGMQGGKWFRYMR